MASAKPRQDRPMSPHLSIYRPLWTMMMSIFHRVTGAANYFGLAVLAIWLASVASGPAGFDALSGLLGSIPGQIILFGLTWTVVHHMIGGVRHLVWDTIHGFELRNARKMAQLNLVASLVIAVALWVFAYYRMGAI